MMGVLFPTLSLKLNKILILSSLLRRNKPLNYYQMLLKCFQRSSSCQKLLKLLKHYQNIIDNLPKHHLKLPKIAETLPKQTLIS